jgi:hypothetical protein
VTVGGRAFEAVSDRGQDTRATFRNCPSDLLFRITGKMPVPLSRDQRSNLQIRRHRHTACLAM